MHIALTRMRIEFRLGTSTWRIEKDTGGLCTVSITREQDKNTKKKEAESWVQLRNATLGRAEDYIAQSTRRSIYEVQTYTRGEQWEETQTGDTKTVKTF